MPYLEGIQLPQASVDDAGYWAACKRHELVIQQCTKCGTLRHPPTPVCYNCQSFDFDWKKMSGKGTIYSYVNVTHPVHPALRERVPFNLVVVELAEDASIRMTGNVVDTPFEELYIGMPVEVVWETYEKEEVVLPRFKRDQG